MKMQININNNYKRYTVHKVMEELILLCEVKSADEYHQLEYRALYNFFCFLSYRPHSFLVT